MATASLLPNAEQQFTDGNGAPYASGYLYFYVPGTTTQKTVWADPNQTTPLAQPVNLDANGRCIVYGTGAYRQQLYDQNNVLVWDQLTQGAGSSGGGNYTAVLINGTTTPTYAVTASQSAVEFIVTQGTCTFTPPPVASVSTAFSPIFYGVGSGVAKFQTFGGTTINGVAAGTVTVGTGLVGVLGTDAVAGYYLSGTVSATSTPNLSARQTVLSGATTAGVPSAIAIGTGLAANLLATSVPVVATFATGFGSAGDSDTVTSLSGDQVGFWNTLPANNLNYLGISSVNFTAFQTLAPPQYGPQYNRAMQSLLQFGGVAGSTTFLDDFGNTWTAQGNAKVQNTQVKYGTGALGGGGTSNVMNGTTDYIKSTSFTSMPNGAWAMRCWFYMTANPGAGTNTTLMSAENAGNFGAFLGINNTGGVIRLIYSLSSTGTSFDIAAGILGITTPTLNTWHFVELTFDIVAGAYRLYLDGSQENFTTSTLHICPLTLLEIGANANGTLRFFTGYIDKFELVPYCSHPAGTTYTNPAAAPSITTAGYASDWFDTVNMVMNTPSAASGSGGTNPTFTSGTKLYMGEATTGASTVSSVITYAYGGRYDSGLFAVTVATNYTKAHNLGIVNHIEQVFMANDAGGWNERPIPGYMYDGANNVGFIPRAHTRNTSVLATQAQFVMWGDGLIAQTTGFYRLVVTRGW